MANPLRVSEAASLALHAMVFLAVHPATPVSTRGVAEALGASQAHMSKVLQRLSKAGLVNSTAGPTGGFQLARPSEQITLQEVYEVIEGPLTPVKCLFGKPVCVGEQCIFGDSLEEVDRKLRGWLADTTLSEVAYVFAAQET